MSNLPEGFSKRYHSSKARKMAIYALKREGFNYFICFMDDSRTFALYWTRADWLRPGQVEIK